MLEGNTANPSTCSLFLENTHYLMNLNGFQLTCTVMFCTSWQLNLKKKNIKWTCLVGWGPPAIDDSDAETLLALNRAVRGLPSSCTPTETHWYIDSSSVCRRCTLTGQCFIPKGPTWLWRVLPEEDCSCPSDTADANSWCRNGQRRGEQEKDEMRDETEPGTER